jgi:hypothetical protein
MWRTDGTRFFRLASDSLKPPSPKHNQINIGEIGDRIGAVEDLCGLPGPLEHFGAGVFSLPTDPTKDGHQLAIRQRYIYERQKRNARWLEARKVREGIAYLESGLSGCSKKDVALGRYIQWVRCWQNDSRFNKIRGFYNSAAVRHRSWDTKISMRSCLDRACECIERLPGDPKATTPLPTAPSSHSASPQRQRRQQEHSAPARPTLYMLGDGDFNTNMKGMQPSRHRQLVVRLYQRVKQRQPGSFVVGIDEYCSSQRCPRCLHRLQFLRREPRSQWDKRGRGADGLVEERRVQYCQACDLHYNRDTAAAQCFCITAETVFKTGQRPAQLTRPPRQ